MLSKIYYGLGASVIGLYLLGNLLGLRSSNPPQQSSQQPRSFGALRMERGKYVYVPPTTYPSSGSNPYSSGSRSTGGSRSSSYPSSGGYSGGK